MPHLLRWQSSTQAFTEPLGERQQLTMLRCAFRPGAS